MIRNAWQIRADKAAARKTRRKDNARFIAKTQGKPLLPKRTAIRSKLDAITSLIVRLRDKKVAGGYCLVCMAKKRLGMIQDRPPNPITLAYHVERRGKEAIRWSLDNIVGACSACNQWERLTRYQNPALVVRVHTELIGESHLSELELAGKIGAKYSTAELVLMLEQRKALLERP